MTSDSVNQEGELEFRSLFENAADAIFIADEQTGIIIDANMKAARMMNLSVEKIIGLHQSELHPPETEELSKKTFAKNKEELKNQKYANPVENQLITSSGTKIPIEVLASKVIYKGKSCLMGTFRDISERKKAEKALRENEANLKAIIENSLESIWSIDTDYNIQYVNEVFAGEFQKTFNILLKQGVNILEALPLPLRDLWKKRYDRAFNNEHFVLTDKIDLDNTPIFIEVAMNPIVLDGKVVGASFYGKNISENKAAENSLRESEERFRTLSSVATEGLMIHRSGTILEANHAFARILGYADAEELIGKDGMEILGLTPKSKAAVRHHLENKSNETYEIEITRQNGDLLSAETSGIEINYKGGTARLVYMRDISERKQAEAKIKRIEAMQAKMVANISDVIIITDKDGINKYHSPNAQRLFGWMPEEVVGRSLWESIHPEDLEDVQKIFTKNIQQKSSSHTMEFRYKCKDGSYRWIEFTANNLLHDSDINGILGNYKEITERKKNEQELINAKEKAEESDRLKSAFLANMSHEIRTPMNGILGFAELLKSKNLSGKEQEDFLDIIGKSGERMLNIINDLINISKIEAGQSELVYSPTNLNEQLNFLYIFFKEEAEQKGLRLQSYCPLPASEVNIRTDKEKVYAILTNLIKNAIKFTDKGSVDFGYTIKGKFIEFYVKDTGIGIPKDKFNSVFERFVQADLSVSSGYEGSGLGLSITRAYVEMLGGKIGLESNIDKGSLFTFTIPLEPLNQDPSQLTELFRKNPSRAKNCNHTILIAEDDEASLFLLKSVIKEHNCSVIIARNGIEAIDMLQKHKDISLILMDIKMPQMDGYEAAQKIKEIRPDLPIIAQTSYALKSDRVQFGDTFDDYIIKPIKPDDFMEIVSRHLKN